MISLVRKIRIAVALSSLKHACAQYPCRASNLGLAPWMEVDTVDLVLMTWIDMRFYYRCDHRGTSTGPILPQPTRGGGTLVRMHDLDFDAELLRDFPATFFLDGDATLCSGLSSQGGRSSPVCV